MARRIGHWACARCRDCMSSLSPRIAALWPGCAVAQPARCVDYPARMLPVLMPPRCEGARLALRLLYNTPMAMPILTHGLFRTSSFTSPPATCLALGHVAWRGCSCIAMLRTHRRYLEGAGLLPRCSHAGASTRTQMYGGHRIMHFSLQNRCRHASASTQMRTSTGVCCE
jgi:hypothetical protein